MVRKMKECNIKKGRVTKKEKVYEKRMKGKKSAGSLRNEEERYEKKNVKRSGGRIKKKCKKIGGG